MSIIPATGEIYEAKDYGALQETKKLEIKRIERYKKKERKEQEKMLRSSEYETSSIVYSENFAYKNRERGEVFYKQRINAWKQIPTGTKIWKDTMARVNANIKNLGVTYNPEIMTLFNKHK
uniref:Uncharacterized protein n=1 Tax=Pithovirus LCDPAC01 TaxID=2506600 RepID=A0A481YNT5_9VIRU|nr:MAG: hypothetical protein LCDPAC01_01050 [Pithovirus LCDPAC01]